LSNGGGKKERKREARIGRMRKGRADSKTIKLVEMTPLKHALLLLQRNRARVI
jgi:hypothetical protein